MKTIDFDIEKAKSGDYKIVNNAGCSVRIVCWDFADEKYPLLGLVWNGEREYVCYYDTYGRTYVDDSFSLRLKVDDELSYENLTEFERVVGLEFWKEDMLKRNDPEILTRVRAIAGRLYDAAIRQSMTDNTREVQFDGLEERTDDNNHMVDITEHITDSKISDEVNTRLNECGWFVCDNNIIKRMLATTDEIIKNCNQ